MTSQLILFSTALVHTESDIWSHSEEEFKRQRDGDTDHPQQVALGDSDHPQQVVQDDTDHRQQEVLD